MSTLKTKTVVDVASKNPNSLHERICIIFPYFDNRYNGKSEIDRLMFSAVQVNAKEPEAMVYVFDNSPPPNTLLPRFPFKHRSARKRASHGYADLVNYCLDVAREDGYEFAVIMHHDSYPRESFLKHMLKTFDSDANIGVVGGAVYCPRYLNEEFGKIQNEGYLITNGKCEARSERKEILEHLPGYVHAVSSCMMGIRLSEKMKFDPRVPFRGSDIQFCMDNWEMGLRVAYNHNILCEHKGPNEHYNTTKELLKLSESHLRFYMRAVNLNKVNAAMRRAESICGLTLRSACQWHSASQLEIHGFDQKPEEDPDTLV